MPHLFFKFCKVPAFATALALLGNCASYAATYSYTGQPFTTFNTFTAPCAASPCANFAAGNRVQGSFTTAAPLAANLANQNILAQVTGFTFSDGLRSYSSSDTSVTLMNATITTDASGKPVSMSFIPIRWRTAAPHAVNDRVDYLIVMPTFSTAEHNAQCVTLSPPAGCSGLAGDASTSRATENAVTRPVIGLLTPSTAASVPGLGGAALLALITLINAAALMIVMRRNAALKT